MKILILSEFITPVNAIGSIRWSKFGKYLAKDHGHQIDILTNSKRYDDTRLTTTNYGYDKLLAQDLKCFGRVFEFNDTFRVKMTNVAKNLIKKRLASKPSANGEDLAPQAPPKKRTPPSQGDSAPSTMDTLNELFLKMREASFVKRAVAADIPWDEYDVLISSYGPQWTHRAAKLIKEAHPHLTWIADYRDSPAYSKRTMTQDRIDFGKTVTDSASCVFTVSPLEHMCLNLADGQRSEVIPNGYDGEEGATRTRRRSNAFLITYTGTLYNDGEARRDLSPLLQAIDELIDEGLISRTDIEFRYCGMNSSTFEEQMSEHESIPWRCEGNIPRSDALKLQEESSLLVLCTWNTRYARGVVTGKIFEYFSSGVPIICLCSGEIPGALSKEMIEKSGTGFAYEEASADDDYPLLKSYVLSQYRTWKESGATEITPNEQYIEAFDHKNLANNIHALLEEIVD